MAASLLLLVITVRPSIIRFIDLFTIVVFFIKQFLDIFKCGYNDRRAVTFNSPINRGFTTVINPILNYINSQVKTLTIDACSTLIQYLLASTRQPNPNTIVTLVWSSHHNYKYLLLEMCMGMGNAGFPSLPWDSYGNGNQIA